MSLPPDSKHGSAWLRWVLNQAAQTAERSPDFAATYAASLSAGAP